jgi:hypothetical protein
MSDVMERPQEAAAPTPQRMSSDDMISKYIRLRDKVKAIKDRHTEELAPYNNAMSTLEGWMLETLNAAGLQSMKSPHGTAYKSVRTSAKVIDWPATLSFIKANEAWDLLEARVSKLAAQAIIDETQLPIPGVETSSEIVVNVRRASADPGGK